MVAPFVIYVIDGHTFRTIDKKSASPIDNSGVIKLTGPSRPFDAAGLPAISDPLENEGSIGPYQPAPLSRP
jgi:hypothetical protein